MVAEIINSESTLEVGNKSQVINLTDEIKSFLSAVNKKDENKIKSMLINGTKYTTIFNGYKWTDIDKSQFTRKGSSDAVSTRMQENASLFAIKKSIENNGYTDIGKFMSLYRDELLEIYPDMNEEWENVFFQQQLTVYKQLGNTKFGHYSRDAGFMDYITKFVKKKYGIVKKDSWDPADIWLVANLEKTKKELENKIIDNTTPIEEFNSILREDFHTGKIVGISLKKMSGKIARWEMVNLENMDIYDNKEYNFTLLSAELSFKLANNGEFVNSDSKLVIHGKKGKIKFQIRQNSAGFNNLKIEGTDLGATSARLGKVPLDMAERLFKSRGLKFDNKNQNFPKNEQQFLKRYDYWSKLFNSVKQYTGVNEEEFKNNVLKVFNSKRPDFAHSKMMQLYLFSQIFSLNKDVRDDLLTALAYLSQKKGAVFGPFAKLY